MIYTVYATEKTIEIRGAGVSYLWQVDNIDEDIAASLRSNYSHDKGSRISSFPYLRATIG